MENELVIRLLADIGRYADSRKHKMRDEEFVFIPASYAELAKQLANELKGVPNV